jgi:hypothetical protein
MIGGSGRGDVPGAELGPDWALHTIVEDIERAARTEDEEFNGYTRGRAKALRAQPKAYDAGVPTASALLTLQVSNYIQSLTAATAVASHR